MIEPVYIALGGLVHLAVQNEITTLCGRTISHDPYSLPVEPRRIRCDRCVARIELCAAVPRKHYRDRQRRKTKA